MQKTILAATTLVALTSLSAYAQTGTPPTPPTPAQMVANQVARLTKLLDLSSSQQTSATTIFTTEQTTLATIRPSMQTARTGLQAAIKINDTATIATDAAQVGTLTGEEVAAQATASGAFIAILNTDQAAKYESLGPLGGPGGPGGPGGFGGPGPHHMGGTN